MEGTAMKIATAIVIVVALTAGGYGLYRLGMHEGVQMSAPTAGGVASAGAQKAGDVDPSTGKKVRYWHDPMVSGPKFDKPGRSPFMDMQLVPMYADGGSDDNAVSVSSRVQQNLGLRTAPVKQGAMSMTVEAVGSKVTRFRPGDEVFGGRTGAFAQYVSVRESRAVAPKPPNVTFEQAASVPIAAITALQALRDQGKVQPGQKVLINGASGGVGTFAVQIAKSLGAEVTGVCSTRNVEMVRSLGADRVIDYTKEDFTKDAARYDVILDNVGNHGLLESLHVLNPKGKYVMVGGPKGTWIDPLPRAASALVLSRFVSQDVLMFVAKLNQADLTFLGNLMQTGKVKPVVERQYDLSQLREAIGYLEAGHARGKVVVTLE